MKIAILYSIKEGAYGGANQFLKALKICFREMGCLAEKEEEADVFLFNSCNEVPRILEMKKKFPDKIFVQRLDGPSRLYADMHDKRDLIANTVGMYLADALVFQSGYCKITNYRMGLKKSRYDTIITNSVNADIFYRTQESRDFKNRKIRIIAASWSSNIKKGFEVYRFLDETLDFTRYEMSFVGNSPYEFRNIRHIPPKNSAELAEIIREHDIFLTASQKEPCSNALIEAMSCGLPAIALKDGGNPEIVKNGGLCFEKESQIAEMLEEISRNYEKYVQAIDLPAIGEIGNQYYAFLELVQKELKSSGAVKKMTFYKEARIKGVLYYRRISDKIQNIKKVLKRNDIPTYTDKKENHT